VPVEVLGGATMLVDDTVVDTVVLVVSCGSISIP
jgi:hypothetical protein